MKYENVVYAGSSDQSFLCWEPDEVIGNTKFYEAYPGTAIAVGDQPSVDTLFPTLVIRPFNDRVVYAGHYLSGDDLEKACRDIAEEFATYNICRFPGWRRILSKKDVLRKTHYCIRRKQDTHKPNEIWEETDIEGTEGYVRIPDAFSRCLIDKTEEILREEVLPAAKKNTLEHSFVKSMRDILGFENDDVPMFIVSSFDGFMGAGAILFPETRKKAAELLGTDEICVFPSSIHEAIVCRRDAFSSKSEADGFVTFGNTNACLGDETASDTATFLSIK